MIRDPNQDPDAPPRLNEDDPCALTISFDDVEPDDDDTEADDDEKPA